MTGLALDGPLAKLYPTAVPFSPVGTVWISLNTNDETDSLSRNLTGDPLDSTLDCICINVGVDATAGKQDQIAEEVGLEDRKWKSVVGLEDLRNRSIQHANQVDSDVVGDNLVDKSRVLVGPRSLLIFEGEFGMVRGVFPSLPDIRRKSGLDIVWVGVSELLVGCHGRHVDARPCAAHLDLHLYWFLLLWRRDGVMV